MAAALQLPRVTVREVELYERPVRLRMPFRFGVVTLTEAPQLFARVRIAADGREAWGKAAEMLAPKWFYKNPALSNAQNFEQLRDAVRISAGLYRGFGKAESAFGLFAGTYAEQLRRGAAQGLNGLVAGFGPALLDRAVLDALCRIADMSIFDAVRRNLPGLAPERLLPEFAGFDMGGFLAALRPAAVIDARHTVGLVDPITAADQEPDARVGDGLPETLEEVIAAYGHRSFKIKVGGDAAADIARLTAIAAVLDRIEAPYQATLDGNEQYADVDGVLALWRRIAETAALRRLCRSVLFVEQPIGRGNALARDVSALDVERPVIIDESDEDLSAFPRARALGYSGVSSKSCKGFYKALINAARCARWNAELGRPRFFMSAEDLTIQAGVALQQDLALAALIGAGHVERNGHHYVDGMRGLPEAEQAAFLAAHPDLYHRAGGTVRLTIRDGRIALGSLHCTGFAAAAEPDWEAMRRMAG